MAYIQFAFSLDVSLTTLLNFGWRKMWPDTTAGMGDAIANCLQIPSLLEPKHTALGRTLFSSVSVSVFQLRAKYSGYTHLTLTTRG